MSNPWPEQGRQFQEIHGWKKEEGEEKVGEADCSQHLSRESPEVIFPLGMQTKCSNWRLQLMWVQLLEPS